MSELLNNSPENLAPSITEETTRILGALGLVWADVTEQLTIDHPEDDRWIFKSEN